MEWNFHPFENKSHVKASQIRQREMYLYFNMLLNTKFPQNNTLKIHAHTDALHFKVYVNLEKNEV